MHRVEHATVVASLILLAGCAGRATQSTDGGLATSLDGGASTDATTDASDGIPDGCPPGPEAAAPSPDGSVGMMNGPPDAGSAVVDAGSDASYRAPGCPASVPVDGDPCTPVRPPSPGSAWPCEYGDNPHCTAVAYCTTTSNSAPYTWQVYSDNPACSPNPTCCPSTFEAYAGHSDGPSTCPFQGSCTYPEGRCACVPCVVGGGGGCGLQDFCGGDGGEASSAGSTWLCEPWPEPPGCPWPRPLLGTACSVPETVYCGYGPLCCGYVGIGDPSMACIGGYWNVFPGGC